MISMWLGQAWESKDGVAEAAPGVGVERGVCVGLGSSGLEELLVHVGAEGPTGGQRPAHKLLCHMPGEEPLASRCWEPRVSPSAGKKR